MRGADFRGRRSRDAHGPAARPRNGRGDEPRYAQCELVCEAITSGNPEAFELIFLMDHAAQSEEQVRAMLKEWFEDPRNIYIQKQLRV